MQRMSAEEFMAQVLDDIQPVSRSAKTPARVARLSPAIRVRELVKVLEETVRGERVTGVRMRAFRVGGLPRRQLTIES
jgi:hypothetical protein